MSKIIERRVAEEQRRTQDRMIYSNLCAEHHLIQKQTDDDIKELKLETKKKADNKTISTLMAIVILILGVIWYQIADNNKTLHNRITKNDERRIETDEKIKSSFYELDKKLTTIISNLEKK